MTDLEFDYKCPTCKNDLPLFGCGTATTYSLFKCENCGDHTAIGWSNGFIPKEVTVKNKIELDKIKHYENN